MKLSYIIIDDEPKARKLLMHYLGEMDNLIYKGEYKNCQEARSFVLSNSIDLIFLDIEMPTLLGTDFIRTVKTSSQIIFCTAYHKFASEAFDLNALDYIVKPITKSRLSKAVSKAVERKKLMQLQSLDNSNRNNIISLKRGNRNRLVHKDQIIYIEAAEDYVKYYLQEDMFMVKKTLKVVLNELGDQFIQIHRSYIINKLFIHSIAANSVMLSNKHEIPLGRVYKPGLKKVYLN